MNPNLSRGFFILSLDNFKEMGGGSKIKNKKKTLQNFFKFRMVHFPRKGVVADPNPNFFRNKEQGYKGCGSRWFSKNPKFSCFFLVGASLSH